MKMQFVVSRVSYLIYKSQSLIKFCIACKMFLTQNNKRPCTILRIFTAVTAETDIFLMFAQNMDYGHTLEPPQ